VAQGTDPAQRAANCAAAGINTATFTSNVVNATAQGTTSGNQNLVSEVAFSKTFGIVLRPRWVPKLNISVDYIDIALKDAISSLTLVNNLDACYDSTDFPNSGACGTFTRDPATHQITNFHAGFVNAGLLEFTGIQAALDYTWNLPWALGNLETSAHYLDTQRLKSQIATASPIELSGSLGGNNPGPTKSKGNLDLLYTNGGFSWDVQGIFIGSMNLDNAVVAGTRDYMTVGHWWLINSTLGMKFTPQLQARFIVDNVFNKQPPFPALAATSGNFANAASLYFSGILGRALQLSVDYKFY
jgi:outer membrane receptor protein involved in Fe transport